MSKNLDTPEKRLLNGKRMKVIRFSMRKHDLFDKEVMIEGDELYVWSWTPNGKHGAWHPVDLPKAEASCDI